MMGSCLAPQRLRWRVRAVIIVGGLPVAIVRDVFVGLRLLCWLRKPQCWSLWNPESRPKGVHNNDF